MKPVGYLVRDSHVFLCEYCGRAETDQSGLTSISPSREHKSLLFCDKCGEILLISLSKEGLSALLYSTVPNLLINCTKFVREMFVDPSRSVPFIDHLEKYIEILEHYKVVSASLYGYPPQPWNVAINKLTTIKTLFMPIANDLAA